jgi:hypothetical protein
MKFLKMLGLAAIVGAALMVVVGPASASAAESGTTICKTNTTPCPAASHYTTGQTYKASLTPATEATLAAGFSTIKCTGSSVELEQTGTGGAAAEVPGSIKALSFSGCNATVTVKTLGSGNVSHTAATMNGSLTGSGTEVEIVLGSTKCFYGGTIKSGLTVEGGAPATATASNAEFTRLTGSSALCANPAKWNAMYQFEGTSSTAYVSGT